jgi:DNA-binding XRE family transcriptional regulator
MSEEAGIKPGRTSRQLVGRSSDRYDRQIARRVYEQRTRSGLSRVQVADAIGVSYQQVHKYETGLNRISAGHLYAIAQVLGDCQEFRVRAMG